MKAILVIMDGLGDRPIREFKGKTVLEAAKSLNLDKLAKRGISGLMDSVAPGITPGSDTAHLSIFGLDPEEHYHGRGPLEAFGVGLRPKHGDIALRANIGTVGEGMVIEDRRAGRIKGTEEFCREMDGTRIDGVEVILKPGAWYRASLVLRGKGLSDKVTGNDIKKVGIPVQEVKPLDGSKAAKKTAAVLNKITKMSHERFKDLDINKKRVEQGKLPGNVLLFRGAGQYVPVPTLEDRYHMKCACIGTGLYRGISAFLGMDLIDVPGATGRYDSDFTAKTKKAKEIMGDYDFIFIHMKATDSAGEDGNPGLKREMVEKMDEALGELLDFDGLVVVTADHTTPCELKKHSYEPVPLVMAGPGIRVDSVVEFGERSCARGDLHRIRGLDLMNIIANHMGFMKIYGA